ncbi:hypothetical protein LOD99_3848 [Oopsacas minuta]|uniref:BZIP domain-containing protein n=1 Tax=Oopsacas minuta TaxID=111878 RepID=A0AAV7JWQ9_9METZ|nr:hypothetical protein LOD99_3848 [Oopsacas minuta]
MDLKGVNFRPLHPVLVSNWQELVNRGEPLAQLIDYSALLSINGSIVNRLFREANVSPLVSAPILNMRYSRKKAVDKRNQRMRDRSVMSGLDTQVCDLLRTKRLLEEERADLANEISFYRDLSTIRV